VSSANESELMPVSPSHLQISATEVEPSGVSLGKGVTRVTEVQHPGRPSRAGRSKRAGWMTSKPYSEARLIGDCLASGRPRSMIQS
jgi:hypothetical protein